MSIHQTSQKLILELKLSFLKRERERDYIKHHTNCSSFKLFIIQTVHHLIFEKRETFSNS